jgi:hypothetical protein
MRREAVVASLRYSSGICLQELNNAMKMRTVCVTGNIQNTSQKHYVIKTKMLTQSR